MDRGAVGTRPAAHCTELTLGWRGIDGPAARPVRRPGDDHFLAAPGAFIDRDNWVLAAWIVSGFDMSKKLS